MTQLPPCVNKLEAESAERDLKLSWKLDFAIGAIGSSANSLSQLSHMAVFSSYTRCLGSAHAVSPPLSKVPKFSSLAALAKHLICQNYLIDLQVADRGLIHTLVTARHEGTDRASWPPFVCSRSPFLDSGLLVEYAIIEKTDHKERSADDRTQPADDHTPNAD